MSHYCDLYLFYVLLTVIENGLKLFRYYIEVAIASHQNGLIRSVAEPAWLKANNIIRETKIGMVLG